ncbi:hypothetical protein RJI07_06180 [Mycoplasmatota bacterium WC30]
MHIHRMKPSDRKSPTFGINGQRPKGRNLGIEALKNDLKRNIYQTRRLW